MTLLPGSFYSGSTVLLSWVAGSLTQPAIKRTSAIALINAVCNTPNGKSPPKGSPRGQHFALTSLTRSLILSLDILPLPQQAKIPHRLPGQPRRGCDGDRHGNHHVPLPATAERQAREGPRGRSQWTDARAAGCWVPLPALSTVGCHEGLCCDMVFMAQCNTMQCVTGKARSTWLCEQQRGLKWNIGPWRRL